MKADEIRRIKIETTCDVATDQVAPQVNACAFFLQEVAAQLAEIKELLAAKQERAATGKRPKQIKSAMRMNGKKFYVHCWTMTAGEDMLSGFVPNEGQKPISELERTEFTVGTLGSNKDCKISRTQ